MTEPAPIKMCELKNVVKNVETIKCTYLANFFGKFAMIFEEILEHFVCSHKCGLVTAYEREKNFFLNKTFRLSYQIPSGILACMY